MNDHIPRVSVAPVGYRIGAYLIDSAIIILYCFVMGSAFVNADIEDIWVWSIFIIAPLFLYHLIAETLMKGQSPGKRAMNVRIVCIDGSQPNVGHYLARWCLGLIEIYLSLGMLALVVSAIHGQGQRLGDMIAGTQAVKTLRASNYQVAFPQVVRLELHDIELLERALKASEQYENPVPENLVAGKMKISLNITTELSAHQFLATLLKDYYYLKFS